MFWVLGLWRQVRSRDDVLVCRELSRVSNNEGINIWGSAAIGIGAIVLEALV